MTSRGLLPAILLGAALVASLCARASALDAENVLVLYNASASDGAEIAQYYQQVHPGVSLLGLTGVGLAEETDADTYLGVIRPQVLAGLDDSIDCIVTTKGLPLRIRNPEAPSRYSSLESELARVDSIGTAAEMGNQNWTLPAMWGGNPLARNPYFDAGAPFSHGAYGIRLTSRLDGFSTVDVKAGIDRAANVVVAPGMPHFVVDDDPEASYGRMTELVEDVLAPRGANCVFDETDNFIGDAPGSVLGYVSHGRHGGAPADYVPDEENGLRFPLLPGAVFHTFESYNAYSFEEDGNRYGQALVAEWIGRGGTVGLGHVEEPGASSYNVSHEDRFTEMLLEGYTWAEAAWGATVQLSFVNTVVGDPLMRWRRALPGDADLDGDVDVGDLIVWNVHRGQTDVDCTKGDFNNDGVTDVNDLIIWNSNKFTYLVDQVESGGFATIPEPAGISLLMLGGIAAALRRKRR